jgi:ABC-2 type transport system ATP-binding protein
MVSNSVINVKNLRKNYGDIEAVRGISFQVSKGEVFALLGPNGAGKTTTVEILEGHRGSTAGEVVVLGHNPALNEVSFKRRIGIVLQQTGVQPYLTVEETLKLFRGYYLRPRSVDDVIEATGLETLRSIKVSKLSGGQQRRLDVAVGLIGNPELLFLDEPTTGFDPSARRAAWQMVKNLQTLGKTVFLTTHYMDEAEYLADRVALMVNGQIIAEGSPADLAGKERFAIKFLLDKPLHNFPETLSINERNKEGAYIIKTDTPEKALFDLTAWALQEGISLQNLNVSKPSLEEIYLQIVDREEVEGNHK